MVYYLSLLEIVYGMIADAVALVVYGEKRLRAKTNNGIVMSEGLL